MSENSVTCLNGKLDIGDLVLSVPGEAYSCLIGSVLSINLLGSSEHTTGNETDDVHVNFMIMEYSQPRMRGIADMCSRLYPEKKEFDECSIDYLIMAPEMLIRITGLDEDIIRKLLSSQEYAELFCHDVLIGGNSHNTGGMNK